MRHVVSAALLAVALIHVLPVSGVLGAEQLAQLYGIGVAEPNVEILLRHRAVLFGILGAWLAAAAFLPVLQPAAFMAGLASVGSFLVVAWQVGGYNAQVSRVVVADLVAFVGLAVGLAAYVGSRRVARR